MILKKKDMGVYKNMLCLDENLLKACNDLVYSKLDNVDGYDKIQSFITESIFYLDKKLTIFSNNVKVSYNHFKNKKQKTINLIKNNNNLKLCKIKVMDKNKNIDYPDFTKLNMLINKEFNTKELRKSSKNINTKFIKTIMGDLLKSKTYKYNSSAKPISFNELQYKFEKGLYIDYYNASSKEDILKYINMIDFDFYTYGKVQDIFNICINKFKYFKQLSLNDINYIYKDKENDGLKVFNNYLKCIFDFYNMVTNIIMSLTTYKNLYAYNLFDYNLNNIFDTKRINLSESTDFIDYNINNIFINNVDNITDVYSADIDIHKKLQVIVYEYLSKINSKINMLDNIKEKKIPEDVWKSYYYDNHIERNISNLNNVSNIIDMRNNDYDDIKSVIEKQAKDSSILFNHDNISFINMIGLDYTDISNYLYQYKIDMYNNKNVSVDEFMFNNKDLEELNHIQNMYKQKTFVNKDEIQEKIIYLIYLNKLLDVIIYHSTK